MYVLRRTWGAKEGRGRKKDEAEAVKLQVSPTDEPRLTALGLVGGPPAAFLVLLNITPVILSQ